MADTRRLQPRFRRYAEALLRLLRDTDPGYRVTSGRRTYVEQARLFWDWAHGKAGIYTPARPGTSMHERGWAVDMARPDVEPTDDEGLKALGRYWRSLGGVWGGDADPVHFEAPKSWTGRA